MTDDLPPWYPLANASVARMDGWLRASAPPYAEMQDALPWLDTPYQFDAWIAGARDATSRMGDGHSIADVLPGILTIPLPPRRIAGRVTR